MRSKAVNAGLTPVQTFALPNMLARYPGAVLVSGEVMNSVSYGDTKPSVISVFQEPAAGAIEIDGTLLLGAENLEKPGNLGAMLRTADAIGANHFLALGTGPDVFNPNCIVASTGAVFSVPVTTGPTEYVVSELRAAGIRLVVASGESSRSYWETDFTVPSAIVVGAEHAGVSVGLKELADEVVSIPMAGTSDSLNASVALAVISFEARRQVRSNR